MPTPIPTLLCAWLTLPAQSVPNRSTLTSLELLLGAMITDRGFVTEALLAITPRRKWPTYFKWLEGGKWSWIAVAQRLCKILVTHFAPPVWYLVIDDTLVPRASKKAPDVGFHFDHSRKPEPVEIHLGSGLGDPGRRRPCQDGRHELGGSADFQARPQNRQPWQTDRCAGAPAGCARPLRSGPSAARHLVHAGFGDHFRPGRRADCHRPGQEGPRSLPAPASAPRRPARAYPQVWREDDRTDRRRAEGDPLLPVPLWSRSDRPLSLRRCAGEIPRRPGGPRRLDPAGG